MNRKGIFDGIVVTVVGESGYGERYYSRRLYLVQQVAYILSLLTEVFTKSLENKQSVKRVLIG